MQKIKSFLKKGNGESLGFCYILPSFVLVLLIVISIAQIALAQEQLEYVVYSTARAAAICDNYETACSDAQLIAESSLEDDYDDIDVSVKIDGNNPSLWAKGVYIEVTVTCKVDTVFSPLGSNQKSSVVMMIEKDLLEDEAEENTNPDTPDYGYIECRFYIDGNAYGQNSARYPNELRTVIHSVSQSGQVSSLQTWGLNENVDLDNIHLMPDESTSSEDGYNVDSGSGFDSDGVYYIRYRIDLNTCLPEFNTSTTYLGSEISSTPSTYVISSTNPHENPATSENKVSYNTHVQSTITSEDTIYINYNFTTE